MGSENCNDKCRRALGLLILAIVCIGQVVDARLVPTKGFVSDLAMETTAGSSRTLSYLVQPPPVLLTYHNGPVMTADISVYLLFYGSFNESGKQVIRDFFSSFASSPSTGSPVASFPTVRSWWHMTAGYVDSKGVGVSPNVVLAGELNDAYSMGTRVTEAQVQQLVVNSLSGSFPADPNAVYFVLTAEDVTVATFCSVCGSHAATFPSAATGGKQLPYAWVGNSATQCPSLCAWPFAKAEYGPPLQLTSPNHDVGIDGMIINIATLFAGLATNPFDTGYFQGDASAPLEAATSCAGIYGAGAYPGDPGQLFLAPTTNASFNAVGSNLREFLLPALWLPENLTCTPPPMG